MYNQKQFQDDFDCGRRGFQISFCGTSLVAHFLWIVSLLWPSPVVLLLIWQLLQGRQELQHLSLQNHMLLLSFLLRYESVPLLAHHLPVLAFVFVETKTQQRGCQDQSPWWFHLPPKQNKDFSEKGWRLVWKRLSLRCREFNHCEPIVSVQVMHELIAEGDIMFGELWQLLLEVRGSVNTRDGSKRDAKEKSLLQQRNHNVFLQLLWTSRMSHRCPLANYAFVLNVASIALGIGWTTDTTFLIFKHVSPGVHVTNSFARSQERKKGCIVSNTT